MSNTRFMLAVMLGLLAWGLWIAAGAWAHPRGTLEFAIISGSILSFLSGWWLLWQARLRRLNRIAEENAVTRSTDDLH